MSLKIFTDYCILEVNNIQYKLEIANIVHIWIENGVIKFLDNQGKTFSAIAKFNELAGELKKYRFFRVHRGHIVNVRFISQINRCEKWVKLNNGIKIPLARRRIKKICEAWYNVNEV